MQYMIMSDAHFNPVTFLLLVKQLVANILYSANTLTPFNHYYFFFTSKGLEEWIAYLYYLHKFRVILSNATMFLNRGAVIGSRIVSIAPMRCPQWIEAWVTRFLKASLSLYCLHPVNKSKALVVLCVSRFYPLSLFSAPFEQFLSKILLEYLQFVISYLKNSRNKV